MGRVQPPYPDPDSDAPAPALQASEVKSILGTVPGTDIVKRIAVDSNGSIITTASTTTTTGLLSHEFARIKNKQFKDTEEVRYDIPLVLISANAYVGVAVAGTATSSATWTIIRTDFDANKNPSRDRVRFNLSWDNRTVGW